VPDIPREGQVLKYRQTGELFEVGKIAREFVILQSRDGISQAMTGKNSVFSVFEKIPKGKGGSFFRERLPHSSPSAKNETKPPASGR
jgi:hypothetical protein